MVRLRILGQVELSTADGSRLPTPQPKLLALLSYLAASHRAGPVRRDTLLALFWPDLDALSARHALSQALSAIRSEIGPEVLDSRWRESVALDPARVWCDAVAFRAVMKSEHYSAALELYTGPLLDGVYVSSAPEFERWVEDERRELNRLAVQAALVLAEGAAAGKRWTDGCHWAQRGLALDPYDESVWRMLLTCLDGAGDRAGAMATFQQLTRRLRDDLDVEPSPETVRLIDSVRARCVASADNADLASGPITTDKRSATDEVVTSDVHIPAAPSTASARSNARRGLGLLLRLTVTGAVIVSVLTGLIWTMATRRVADPAPIVDANAIAVLPFRVTGLDSVSEDLRAGMVDLMAIKLNAATGLRAVEPRAMFYAYDRVATHTGTNLPLDTALALAARLGAGRLLLGSAVGTPGRLMLATTLYSVPDGKVLGWAEVNNSADSLMPLIDQLAAKVLSLTAGEDESRLESLATTSLPALRIYLGARAAYRAGDYLEALKQFDQALGIDTTFALAAMGVMASVNWVGDQYARGAGYRADQRAWANRHRLGKRDSLRLLAFLGFRRPGATPVAEHIAFIERTLTEMPDDAELWFELGEQLLHQGPIAAVADWRPRAEAAFERAFQLDSAHVPSLIHLVHLAADRGDSTELKHHVKTYLARFPDGHEAQVFRWLTAVLAGDSTAFLESGITDLNDLDNVSLSRLIMLSQSYAVALTDAERALAILDDRAASAPERARVAGSTASLALARGQPERARQARIVLVNNEQDSWFRSRHRRNAIYSALYADGDSAVASFAAGEIASLERPPAASFPERSTQLADVCALELWRISQGQTTKASEAIQKLRSAAALPDPIWHLREVQVCTALLEVLFTEASGAGVGREMLIHLDSVLIAHPLIKEFGPPPSLRYGNLVSARLWAAQGDTGRAMAALQRRSQAIDAVGNPPAFLREECRLAVGAGDHERAQHACEQFLALVMEAEPIVRGKVEPMRTDYLRLRSNSRTKSASAIVTAFDAWVDAIRKFASRSKGSADSNRNP